MSRVFIPQEPMRVKRDGSGEIIRDPKTHKPELESIMNFTKAAAFGETIICLPPGKVALSTQPTIHKLKECLKNFSDEDYLIAVGDPSVIAMASAIASANNCGRFKMLKYDKGIDGYIRVDVDLYHKPRKED